MDYKEKLKHYADYDDIQDVDLPVEAIATLEQNFSLMEEDELIHHNRVKAIAYLALKHVIDNEREKRYWKECYDIAIKHIGEIEDQYFKEHGTNFRYKDETTNQ